MNKDTVDVCKKMYDVGTEILDIGKYVISVERIALNNGIGDKETFDMAFGIGEKVITIGKMTNDIKDKIEYMQKGKTDTDNEEIDLEEWFNNIEKPFTEICNEALIAAKDYMYRHKDFIAGHIDEINIINSITNIDKDSAKKKKTVKGKGKKKITGNKREANNV